MLNVQAAPAASGAPTRRTAPDPAVATMVPAPQLPASPLGVGTTSPAGNVSVKPTPVNAVETLGLLTVKLSEVDPFSTMLAAPKDFTIVGGAGATAPMVMRPTRLPAPSVNHRLPSGPAVMPVGLAPTALMPPLNSVTTP